MRLLLARESATASLASHAFMRGELSLFEVRTATLGAGDRDLVVERADVGRSHRRAANTTLSAGLLSLGHWTASREMFGRVYPTTATLPGGYSDTVVVTFIW